MVQVLRPEARRVWQQVIRPRQLPAWQWQTAVQYCTSMARWQQALAALQEEGEVLESPTGVRYAHPLGRLVKDLGKELQQLSEGLGLAQAVPSSEETAGAKRKPKQRFFG